METQNQIKKKLSQPITIGTVRMLLENHGNIKIMSFAEKLCDQFGFYNPRGKKQIAGCLKALRDLEQAGLITLPQPVRKIKKRSPRRLDNPLPQPQSVPSEVGKISGLK